jgi:hypothetical protein
MVKSVCHVKRFSLDGKRLADNEEVETEMWNFLTQQSKEFYSAGFDALVMRWGKYINVGGGYVEKYMFLPG